MYHRELGGAECARDIPPLSERIAGARLWVPESHWDMVCACFLTQGTELPYINYSHGLQEYRKEYEEADPDKKFALLLEIQLQHNSWIYLHAIHTGYIAQRFAALLSLSSEYSELRIPKILRLLGHGGNLHDLGKTIISNKVWDYPSRHPEEMVTIRKLHAEFGVMVAAAAGLSELYDMIAYHHESLDGSGYPFGMRGNEIPLYAQIIKVADVAQALHGGRPYGNSRRTTQEIGAAMRINFWGREVRESWANPFEELLQGNVGHPLIRDGNAFPTPDQAVQFTNLAAEELVTNPYCDF
ncbi:MAG: HD domain-containing protein [Patescibacteria group bacterium]|nr:HD domain-containing protein [Patescibacteria group bacterium]